MRRFSYRTRLRLTIPTFWVGFASALDIAGSLAPSLCSVENLNYGFRDVYRNARKCDYAEGFRIMLF